jgi:hypothetical protein
MNNIIRLMVMPCKPELHRKWAGVFEAKLGETIICRSRQPFVDGARALLAMGYDPEMVLVMRHATTGTDALKAKLRVAAKLTVDESGPHIRRWKAMPPREGYGYSDENGSEAAE